MFVRYTDMQANQDLYRKIINVAKAEFIKYQQMMKTRYAFLKITFAFI